MLVSGEGVDGGGEVGQVFAVGQQQLAGDDAGIVVGVDQRVEVHRQQQVIEVATDGGLGGGYLEALDEVYQPCLLYTSDAADD